MLIDQGFHALQSRILVRSYQQSLRTGAVNTGAKALLLRRTPRAQTSVSFRNRLHGRWQCTSTSSEGTGTSTDKKTTAGSGAGGVAAADILDSSSGHVANGALSLRVVGTTFDDRQKLVAELKPLQPVLLMREYDNPHDRSAVVVKSLDGTTFGYISAKRTHLFKHDTTIGRIDSVGPVQDGAAKGTLGVTVDCAPARPSATCDVIPRQLLPLNLSQTLSENDWSKIRKPAYQAAGYRCEVCRRKGPQWPVECHESWSVDVSSRTLRLQGVLALCPDCHEVRHMLRAYTRGQAVPLGHLQAVNKWTREETKAYMQHVSGVMERLSDDASEWSVDLGWLYTLESETSNTGDATDNTEAS